MPLLGVDARSEENGSTKGGNGEEDDVTEDREDFPSFGRVMTSVAVRSLF